METIEHRYQKLLADLEELDKKYQPDPFHTDRRVARVRLLLEELKTEIPLYRFSDEEDEIYFFKRRLPEIFSLYIYYREKSALEISEMIGTGKSKEQYRDRLIRKMDEFALENSAFYDYCVLQKTNLDAGYFLRSSPLNVEGTVLYDLLLDPKFCPPCSLKLAMMSAYWKLDEELCHGSGEKIPQNPERAAQGLALKWTGSVAALVELMFGLWKGGYINHGQIGLKPIVRCFEQMLSVDLGNYNRTYQQFFYRKKGDVFFLHKLAADLQKRIDDDREGRQGFS
ncbi:MAG: RteC domain-containing protein [Bacteroidota bacterium]|nr:RteC domain-containing protein [Bacteroidota bacterium]